MREIINIVSEATTNPQKWWLNVNTGDLIDVPHDHYDVFNASRFGVSEREISDIKTKWADDADHDEIVFWDISYHAMLKGWVRLGSFGADGLDHAYIYAAYLKAAQKTLNWMIRHGHFSEEIGIEIMNPEEPMLGHGDYCEIKDDRDLKKFLAKR